ncbi:hypothetical protein ACI6Q2_17485 [Chitinophagaceae bacterium LWZ2-11]
MKKIIRIMLLPVLLSCSKGTVQQTSTPVTTTGTDSAAKTVLPKRVVRVSNASDLQTALNNAQPGDSIIVANGTYNGKFTVPPTVNGTAENRIIVTSSRSAILDAGSTTTGYVLYLQGSYWTVRGMTIQNGLKGIMADGIHYTVIDSVKVNNIGEEGIHLRKFSTHNTIQNTEISNTGIKTPDYGEGVYLGSANSNWATYTNGLPDLCDSNSVLNNKIGPGIAAECIDIKEGTTGGLIRGNTFNSTGITGANSGDSWIDVKGNYYLIDNNIGFNPSGSVLQDGYQVHCAYAGWGCYNSFTNNNSTVNAPGYGFNVTLSSSAGKAVGNKVYTNNIVQGAAKGVSNISLSN